MLYFINDRTSSSKVTLEDQKLKLFSFVLTFHTWLLSSGRWFQTQFTERVSPAWLCPSELLSPAPLPLPGLQPPPRPADPWSAEGGEPAALQGAAAVTHLIWWFWMEMLKRRASIRGRVPGSGVKFYLKLSQSWSERFESCLWAPWANSSPCQRWFII